VEALIATSVRLEFAARDICFRHCWLSCLSCLKTMSVVWSYATTVISHHNFTKTARLA